MLADLVERILEEIPHDQLALQWDTNFEFGMLEGDVPVWFPDVRGGILERLLRISSARAARPSSSASTSAHGHDEAATRARCRPSLGRMADLANALAAEPRTIDLTGFTCPVPRGRTEEAFFAPLGGLRLQAATELYLGR